MDAKQAQIAVLMNYFWEYVWLTWLALTASRSLSWTEYETLEDASKCQKIAAGCSPFASIIYSVHSMYYIVCTTYWIMYLMHKSHCGLPSASCCACWRPQAWDCQVGKRGKQAPKRAEVLKKVRIIILRFWLQILESANERRSALLLVACGV